MALQKVYVEGLTVSQVQRLAHRKTNLNQPRLPKMAQARALLVQPLHLLVLSLQSTDLSVLKRCFTLHPVSPFKEGCVQPTASDSLSSLVKTLKLQSSGPWPLDGAPGWPCLQHLQVPQIQRAFPNLCLAFLHLLQLNILSSNGAPWCK